MEIPRDKLLWLYDTMVTIRRFEERGFHEVTSRRISAAIHRSVGQEAVPAGIGAHLRLDDYLASTHRGHGHCIAKGVDVKLMMAELFGRATGNNRGKGGSMHIADMSKGMLGANGVVGASVPLAVGGALTAQLKGTGQVAVAFFGDGGANQGIVHESMNLAAVWKLPVIFVCENNQYAESTPVEYGVPISNIADRAVGYGFPGVVVDGMDVFAVYEAAGTAVERARSGQGSTLLECKTYRYYGHSGMDNPRSYRTEEEELEWKARDPLDQFQKRVLEEELLKQEELEAIEQRADELIEEAAQFAESSPEPPLEELYTDVYVDYPIEALKRGATMLF
ncbi:MAG: thiamine pyrophosphate-dependent dehydrogenase E1 component subunit alpha [Dehalococcoidia bacterium]